MGRRRRHRSTTPSGPTSAARTGTGSTRRRPSAPTGPPPGWNRSGADRSAAVTPRSWSRTGWPSPSSSAATRRWWPPTTSLPAPNAGRTRGRRTSARRWAGRDRGPRRPGTTAGSTRWAPPAGSSAWTPPPAPSCGNATSWPTAAPPTCPGRCPARRSSSTTWSWSSRVAAAGRWPPTTASPARSPGTSSTTSRAIRRRCWRRWAASGKSWWSPPSGPPGCGWRTGRCCGSIRGPFRSCPTSHSRSSSTTRGCSSRPATERAPRSSS